ncbi:hypothetical protein [uncultured Dokdonia sp.]|uniref:hypothetical protein n=1 Tax=uncultured Dokdonia sp. TaxID=575653 RepID=UPI00260B628B|nr:hypothetical protein [uncultured Dokdonia sp.]
MKYLVDESIITDYPEIFFDKSSQNNYVTTRYINHSRTFASGYGRFYSIPKNYFIYSELTNKEKIKLVGDFVSNVFARPTRDEIINSIIVSIENTDDYTVITEDLYLIEELNRLNKKIIYPKTFKETLDIDYTSLEDFTSEELEFANQQTEIATKVQLTLFFLLILTGFIIYYWEQSQRVLGGAIIIPIALFLSLILFYLKKHWLKFYIILEFSFGFVLCIMVYNFYEQNELQILKKLLAIASGIFVLLRGLNNLDSYLLLKDNDKGRFVNFWKKIFHHKREKIID